MLLHWLSKRFWVLLGATLAAGCEYAPRPSDGDDAGARTDGPAGDLTTPPPFEDVAPSAQCMSEGTGRLRVTVALDPSLDQQTAEVWLGLRCNDHPIFRVVRWDRSSTQVIDGLGPGNYQVYGSSFVAPGSWSPVARLGHAVTAAVPVTLSGMGEVLATYSSNRAPDAGVPPPDSAMDASSAGAWQQRLMIRERGSGATLGVVTVEAREMTLGPVGDGGASPGLAVNVTVQNACATPPCGTLRPLAAEVRSLAGDAPLGVGMERFRTDALETGASTSLLRPVVLRARLPSADHALQVVVYGDEERPGPRG